MAYRVDVTAAAEKDLDRLPKKLFERVDAHILALSKNPRLPGIIKLQGKSEYWRLRVGQYRILCEIHDRERVVLIVRVVHRSKAYRGV